VSDTRYGQTTSGPTGIVLRLALDIDAEALRYELSNIRPGNTHVEAGNLIVDGATIALNPTCPSIPATPWNGWTASGLEFRLQASGLGEEIVFVRSP
jgi:hypothetical protein